MLTLLLSVILTFSSPVNDVISLAGNFGEPRPNHFHGGIDVKTGGVEGKPIFAIADGYVYAVTMGVGGFGNAVYVRHPNGTTSVYCHLKKFSPQITSLLRRRQVEKQQNGGEIRFRPTDLPVAAHQLIAVSGNTGSSQAPHLHLEIHDTKTWDMLDPLDFVGDLITDGFAPLAHGFMAYPQEGEGVFNGGASKQSYGFSAHHLNREFTAWGKVGFGIWANDYMEITYNRYGVRKTQLIIDGDTIFSSDLARIPVQSNMQVNAWGDYEHFLRYKIWYMRTYLLDGVTLDALHTDERRGIFDFNQQKIYQVLFLLTDYKGNQSQYSFTVKGVPTKIYKKNKAKSILNTLHSDRQQYFQLPGMSLCIRKGYLAEDVTLQPTVGEATYSKSYRFLGRSCKLFRYTPLSIRLTKKVPDTSKLYITSDAPSNQFLGGTFRDGWVNGKARELGATYRIAYDDTPPTINPVNESSWSSSKMITIGVVDGESGVASCKTYIDGRFVPMYDVPKSQWLRCDLRQSPIAKTNGNHEFKVIATDRRNNQRVYTTTIKY